MGSNPAPDFISFIPDRIFLFDFMEMSGARPSARPWARSWVRPLGVPLGAPLGLHMGAPLPSKTQIK